MNKYTIQGQEFVMIDNSLSLLNKAAPLIARLRKLTFEYTKDIDLNCLEPYKARLEELNNAVSSINDTLTLGTDENGEPLTDEQKNTYAERLTKLKGKIEEVDNELKNDAVAFNTMQLRNEMESFALIELVTDLDFLKPVFKKILQGGDLSKVDFSQDDALDFARAVVTDFFIFTSRKMPKS